MIRYDQPGILVFGSCVTDLTFYTQKLPYEGETLCGEFETGLGGKGFNQAVAAKNSESRVVFFGSVGNDKFGQAFKSYLDNFKFESMLQETREATGAAAILVDKEGKNSIVVSLGSNKHIILNSDLLKEFRRSVINSQVEIFLTQNETNLTIVREALTITQPKLLNVFNPAPAPTREELQQLQGLIDILTPNESELATLAGWDSQSLTSFEAVEKVCREKLPNIPIILVTMGDKGSLLVINEINDELAIKLTHLKITIPDYKKLVIEPYIVDARDTSGAGDAFNGAFVAGLLRFKNFKVAATYASVFAGLSVTQKGTSQSFPNYDQASLALIKSSVQEK